MSLINNTVVITVAKDPTDKISKTTINHKANNYKQNSYFKLMYDYFNFGYYLGILPFRFCVSSDSEVFLRTSPFRKCIVLICWTFSLVYHYFKQRLRVLVDSQHSNVLTFFNYTHGTLHVLTFSLFYYHAFTKQEEYHQMMVTIKNCELLNHSLKGNTLGRNFLILVIHLVGLIGVPIVGLTTSFEANEWDIWKTYNFSREEGKEYLPKIFHLSNTSSQSGKCCNNLLGTEIILSLLPLLLVSLSYLFLAAFRILSFMHPVVTLHAGVQSFLKEVVREGNSVYTKNRRDHLYRQYAQLKLLKQSINKAWALAYFFSLMDHVLWLATDLTVGMKEQGLIAKFIVFWYFYGVFVLFVVGSEISRKMCIFKAWLSENAIFIFMDQNEYASFRESLEDNGIHVGMTGLYKLDYNFMGQVVVLVITLFIIALQSERSVQ